jgi:uncharacterized protein YceK
MKNIFKIIFVIIFVMILLSQCGSCGSKTNSNDGLCDICGKSAPYKINGEEYCKQHYNGAANWYMNKDK